MAWNDRLKEAAYTSPSGVRRRFIYEAVSKDVEKKTAAFDFPDANGTFIQDLGRSGRRYPLRLIFWGAEYDTEAEAFETGLLERGVGKLEHPIYGPVNVVPFGAITRRDDLKTEANQTIIEVTFWETIGLVYPSAQADPASSVLASVDNYKMASAAAFSDALKGATAVQKANVKGEYESLLAQFDSSLKSIADSEKSVRTQYNAISSSINNSIDILINDPLTLGLQTIQLIQTPTKIIGNIKARISGYRNLLNQVITGAQAEIAGLFHTKDLYGSTYVTGSILSAVNTQFTNRTEALSTADEILSQMNDLTAWRDSNLVTLSVIDTGEAYQQLQESVALAAGFLVEISFTLKQEHRVVLDRERTIVDLAYELYGSVDDQLDFLIDSNELTGSEILELPKGREIIYYV